MTNPYAAYGVNSQTTAQTSPIPGREAEMVANNAGGYGFILDDWRRLERFLITGSELGSYYVGEQKLTAQNAACVLRCLQEDGIRVVRMAHEINVSNRAPKTDPQLFVLALALKHGNTGVKQAVAHAAPAMLRTGTHLLHFVAIIDSLGGWSRAKRRVVARWFTEQDADRLAFQAVKYQNRDGWTMRDALRVAHPKSSSEHADHAGAGLCVHIDGRYRSVCDWICGRVPQGAAPAILTAYKQAHATGGNVLARALAGIEAGLPREALPTEALADAGVWRALLPSMPLHALLRNLGNMTSRDGLTAGSAESRLAAQKLTNVEQLRKSRVHPFAILLATLVYKRGAGIRGSKTWVPVSEVLSALEDAYDLAFANVTPTNKRILVGIDISGSMIHPCVGSPIRASTAATAMAITLARIEPNATVVQFDTAVRQIVPVTKRTGSASLELTSNEGTDLAAPVLWASGLGSTESTKPWYDGGAQRQLPPKKQEYDAFVILTDHETWAGHIHPSQALEKYRRSVNQTAKLVCCSMVANHANIVYPNDALSFGCAGLDANLPSLVSDFIMQ